MDNPNIYLPPATKSVSENISKSSSQNLNTGQDRPWLRVLQRSTSDGEVFITNAGDKHEALYQEAITKSGLPFRIVRPAFDSNNRQLSSSFAVVSDVPHTLLDPQARDMYDRIISEGFRQEFKRMLGKCL